MSFLWLARPQRMGGATERTGIVGVAWRSYVTRASRRSVVNATTPYTQGGVGIPVRFAADSYALVAKAFTNADGRDNWSLQSILELSHVWHDDGGGQSPLMTMSSLLPPGSVSKRTPSSSEDRSNKGNIGIQNPMGSREKAKALVALAHARGRAIELALGKGLLMPTPWEPRPPDAPGRSTAPYAGETPRPILFWGAKHVLRFLEPKDGYASYGRVPQGYKFPRDKITVEAAWDLTDECRSRTSTGDVHELSLIHI